MPRDDSTTVVDRRPPPGADEASSRTATVADTVTIDLPRPETVLWRAEIEQTRRTAIAGVVFNLGALILSPFFGGDPTARRLFIAGLALGALNNVRLWYVAADEGRYDERHVIAYFCVAPFLNAAVIWYGGVFGPLLAMFVFNLYVSCLGYGRRVALVTLIGGISPIFVLGSLIALGWLGDPGLITGSAYMGAPGRWVLVIGFSLFMCLVYAQARRVRELMCASLVERDEAVRRASHREALFLEARQDLERALQQGGLGRFTDQTLGSFKLGALLGRGGMGEVYAATRVPGGEPAAVKMLLPEVIGRPDFVRRFLREVRIAASLDSPHVVKVLEIGDESAPLPYLAMERLEGEDLAQILRREERLQPAALVDLVRQVGRGVCAAAEAGIVHRDLKPQNLFRTAAEPRTWKILDFGVSKLIESGSTLTQGETIGTPQYMAPEQARGAAVDTRADLYAIGAIAYRALTSHQPFKGENVADIVLAVVGTMPVRPGALVAVHRDVDLALAIAIAKKPEDRFQSAEELADALEAAFAGELDRLLRRQAGRLLGALPWGEPG